MPAGEEVVAGAPTARYLELAAPAGVEVGLWEMTPGAARDTEADEVFVVLSGRATVTVSSQDDDELLELTAGSVVRLRAGDRTTWTVHEPLRKLYVQLP
ncbi:cupin domain-containing protein [Streptomyces sp. NP160]|nr:cupin domain-containing protein [Streptomyces sp. NP160]